jgi:uncharacterized protein YabN with tetrapyrrole methylase and pyrophosphatase domain
VHVLKFINYKGTDPVYAGNQMPEKNSLFHESGETNGDVCSVALIMTSMKRPPVEPDPNRQSKLEAFDRLLTIMDELRENCPWDKKQTIETLRHLTIEETYELSDAILDNDLPEVKKELGDLMLHMVFYARIASEKKAFDVADVLNSICDKLIERHPHIYGDVEANDEATVKSNWEKIKLKSGNKSVLEGVPRTLPALVKAIRIQDKARGVGFDWEKK